MRFSVATELPVSASEAWSRVQTSRLLTYITAPIVTFEPISPPSFPDIWQPGRYRTRFKLLGIYLGWHEIVISFPRSDGHRLVRDNGRGLWATRWDHLIVIKAIADDRCSYRDEIEIEAGPLTLLVVVFAQLFYRHRQRRWRSLAQSSFAALI